MRDMVRLGEVIWSIIAGALVTSDTHPYQPIEIPRLARCGDDAWPATGSRLARLIEALKEPGAYTYLERQMASTLTPMISAELRRMPYAEFLGTQYWWIVRAMLMVKRGLRCEACHHEGGILDVHHLSYVHRGSEVFHLEDLTLLCRACHLAQHPGPAPVT